MKKEAEIGMVILSNEYKCQVKTNGIKLITCLKLSKLHLICIITFLLRFSSDK